MKINKKQLAARTLKIGQSRVWFDKNRLEEIKKALTKADIRMLIKDRAIQAKQKKGTSRARARHILKQKRKGRKQGLGSRKGSLYARLSRKERWINRIRPLRSYLRYLRDNQKISPRTFQFLYKKCGGGMFRSKRHLTIYLNEHRLINPKPQTPIIINNKGVNNLLTIK